MTPIIGLLIAVVAGFVASSRRGVLAGVIPPMLAVTAAQSWYLGSGRGHNSPATTTKDPPAYWVVQLIILALICGVAMGIYAIRARRVSRRGETLASLPGPARRGAMLAAATVAGFAATLSLDGRDGPASHPGRQREPPGHRCRRDRDRNRRDRRVRGAVAAEPAGSQPRRRARAGELAHNRRTGTRRLRAGS